MRDEPAVAGQILSEYAALQVEIGLGRTHKRPHRLTERFVSTLGEDLRRHADGQGLSAALDAALLPYENIPVDGSPSERVHRMVELASTHATSSRFPYRAGSLRLRQNLEVYREACQRGDAEFFHMCYLNCKSVLQGRHRLARALRPKRVPWKEFLRRSYRLFPYYLEDWRWLKKEIDKGKIEAPKPVVDNILSIKLDYFKGVLRNGDYISVPPAERLPSDAGVGAAESAGALTVYQILDNQPRGKKLNYETDWHRLRVPIWVQRLAVHASVDVPLESDGRATLDVFGMGEPELIDAFNLAPWKVVATRVLRWDSCGVSDVAGCELVSLPLPLAERPSWDIHAVDYPVWLMIKQLMRLGWEGGTPTGAHTRVTPKVFRNENCVKIKSYYRCCLTLPALLDAGLPALEVDQTEHYYHALLRVPDKSAVLPNLRKKDYLALLQDDDDESRLPAPPPLPSGSILALGNGAERADRARHVFAGGGLAGALLDGPGEGPAGASDADSEDLPVEADLRAAPPAGGAGGAGLELAPDSLSPLLVAIVWNKLWILF